VNNIRSIRGRVLRGLQLLLQGRLKSFKVALALVEDKYGLEIGGPSDVFQGWRSVSKKYRGLNPLPIYDRIAKLDNCNFSSKTLWSTHTAEYSYSPMKQPGYSIIADGSDLSTIASETYDFVLSSHNLEHFANPIKALYEWKRVTRRQGGLILVLPDYRRTFDHRRVPTSVEHMFDDYRRNVAENDETHIPEVLQLHDIALDGTLVSHSVEELVQRSRDNITNRALHHHVFDENNSVDLLAKVGLEVLSVESALPYHIFIIGRWA
jgi:SAM-dependent methyltransferase